MPRKKSIDLTEAELRLMEVIWRKGKATVAEVREELAKTSSPLPHRMQVQICKEGSCLRHCH